MANINLVLNGLKDKNSIFCRQIISIYGSDNLVLQQERYINTLLKFKKLYPNRQEVSIARAPGRLVISGEHLDYHYGHLINTALMQDIIVIAAINSKDSQIILNNMFSNFQSVNIDSVNNIKVRPKPKKDLHWYEYCFATILSLNSLLLRKKNITIPGLYIMIDGRSKYGGIPLGVGLSSSGGLEVSLILAISGLLGVKEDISVAEICDLCVNIESSLGFLCGIQDPCGSLMGGKKIKERGIFCQLIDCAPQKYKDGRPKINTELIKIPDGYAVLVLRVGTMSHTAIQRNRHNIRVFEGELGAFILFGLLKNYIKNHYQDQKHFLDNLQPPFWKPCYFSYSKLRQSGLNITEKELYSLINQLPNNSLRDEIIARYNYLGVNANLFDQFIQRCKIMDNDINTIRFNLRNNILFVIKEEKRVEISALALKNKDMLKFFILQEETGKDLSKYYGIVNDFAMRLVDELKKFDFVLSARMLGPGSGANVAVWIKEKDIEKTKKEVYKLFYDIIPNFNRMSEEEKNRQIISITNSGKGADLLF